MDSQASEELVTGVILEVAELGAALVEIVSLPVGHEVGEVGVLWSESIAEVRVDESAIRVGVISSNKGVCIVLMAEDSIILEAFLELWSSDPAL